MNKQCAANKGRKSTCARIKRRDDVAARLEENLCCRLWLRRVISGEAFLSSESFYAIGLLHQHVPLSASHQDISECFQMGGNPLPRNGCFVARLLSGSRNMLAVVQVGTMSLLDSYNSIRKRWYTRSFLIIDLTFHL